MLNLKCFCMAVSKIHTSNTVPIPFQDRSNTVPRPFQDRSKARCKTVPKTVPIRFQDRSKTGEEQFDLDFSVIFPSRLVLPLFCLYLGNWEDHRKIHIKLLLLIHLGILNEFSTNVAEISDFGAL